MKPTPRSILAALAAFVLSISVMSCATDNTSEPSAMTASVILSQDSTNNPNPCLVRAEWLADTLGLTEEQVAALTAAQDSLRAIAQAEIEAANQDRALIKAALQKYRESMKAAIEATLTADQLALLQSLRPPFHNKGHHGDRGRHRGHHKLPGNDSLLLAKLTVELSLTAEQVTLIQALQADIKTAQPEDPRAAFYDGLKTILTAEQLAKFDELLAKGPKGDGPRKGRGRK